MGLDAWVWQWDGSLCVSAFASEQYTHIRRLTGSSSNHGMVLANHTRAGCERR